MSREIITDSFAGGGGASTGIALALGRGPDVAINHDPEAVAMHRMNHPGTQHFCQNIWQIDPEDAVRGRPVGLAWFSPDCKHFSKAKGGAPVKRNIRDLAWTVVLWAQRVRPRVICLENVEEFKTWGPLGEDGQPLRDKAGDTFVQWIAALRRLGYRVEYRGLRASDYGAPTIRKRLFVIARCDGLPIVWPAQTHGARTDPDVIAGRKLPCRVAADIIDWSLPCHSIFLTREEGRAAGVNRPLAEKTLTRIAKGIQRFVIEAGEPFIVSYAQHGGNSRSGLEPLHTLTASPKDQNQIILPTLIQTGYGERAGQSPRCLDLAKPLGTVVAGGGKHGLVAAHVTKFSENSTGHRPDEPLHTVMAGAPRHGIVAAFLAQHNSGAVGHSASSPLSTLTQRGSQQAVVAAHMLNLKGFERSAAGADEPLRSITAGGLHAAEVRAFLIKYYGAGIGQGVDEPVHSVTTRDRFGLVTIAGEDWQIADIGMRMLSARELYRAQGFPDDYIIDRGLFGADDAPEEKLITKTAQIRMCGNSVCPDLARAIVVANYAPATAERSVA